MSGNEIIVMPIFLSKNNRIQLSISKVYASIY